MKTFTLHLPRDSQPNDPAALEQAEVVADGFAWGAFFFTFLWFLVQRLWLVGFAVLIVLIAFNLGLSALDVHPVSGFFAQVLLSILIGLEANSLKRWTYARRGRPAVDLVRASDRDEAEAKAFARWLAGSPQARQPISRGPGVSPATPPYRGTRPEPVIGLFPEPERPR
jgi:Protein of unknown function (DUF2628)